VQKWLADSRRGIHHCTLAQGRPPPWPPVPPAYMASHAATAPGTTPELDDVEFMAGPHQQAHMAA
jgi:hypothetical protein